MFDTVREAGSGLFVNGIRLLKSLAVLIRVIAVPV